MNENLPTNDLKEYGIINEDNSFSKKLTDKDIENFLKGNPLVADNDKIRVIFSLSENNSKLNVSLFEREHNLKDILEQSKYKIVYNEMTQIVDEKKLEPQNKVYILDKDKKATVEYDLLKDIDKIQKIVAEKKDVQESNRFKKELIKLQEKLQDKIDKFPEIAKDITEDLNIVSKAINTVDTTSSNDKDLAKKQQKSDVELNVDDPDLYQDANRVREEKKEIGEEQQIKRGFRR